MVAPITWAEATSPILWSNIGINWNTPAETGSATYGLTDGFSSSSDHTLGESITFAIDNTFSNTGVATFRPSATFANTMGANIQHGLVLFASASFSMDVTQSNTGVLTTNPSITFALDNAYTSAGNLSFSDSITFSASLRQSALNEF